MHLSTPGGLDGRGAINIAVRWELNYWATRFGLTPDELIRVVAEVGTDVADVRDALFGPPPQGLGSC
jgi:hypothetical protein